ncbi:electron transfer flavoprotein beta subunit lysine methyltransferase-like isoform X3 [Periplaneta americana]
MKTMASGSLVHFTTSRLIKQHTVISTDHMTPEIKLHLITPSCELWTANADNIAFKDPFWAFYWPGGQAVARFLLDNPQVTCGLRVLDVGSGSGACAIAAAKSGARTVTANDIDPVAATAIKMNAALNSVSIDVCTENLIGKSCHKWDCILLGDMFYDAEFAGLLFKWLKNMSHRGKVVLLGDPGRQAFKNIKDNSLTLAASYSLSEESNLENRGFTDACIWKLS